ncbi:MAG: PTS sugar transporter subunit IIA [Planctomycetota bacterium]|nr:PTS sugar transporter subunit IIA [Planctomycetota bacterium]MDA1222227.1 PTS sugar transporter subunit IIA [Planctomycetota bacterium]
MKLSQLLAPELVVHPLAAGDKWDAIQQLLRAAVDAGSVRADAFDAVHNALVQRERSMSTGMDHGVAIPHAAVDEVDDVVTVLGIAPDGIPFGSLDGLPARILVCLVIPRAKKLLHIKTLAEIARLLSKAEVRDALLASADAASALELVREKEQGAP